MERSRVSPESSHWQDLFDRADEGKARKKLDARIEQQRRAITLAGRILSLQHMPGFDDFCKALSDIREHAVRTLVDNTSGDEWMRVLQGQCQAYESILAVMEKGEARVQALEIGLQDLQNQRAMFDRPKQQEAGS